MESLITYFPELDSNKIDQLKKYADLLLWWNERVNLISRQDTSGVVTHHILHSLSILKCIQFSEGSRILDLGTGGGLPGIPLAVCLPGCSFTLVDSRGKKVNAVADMITKLKLNNARARHSRAEDLKGEFDVVVTRAVAPLSELCKWTKRTLRKEGMLIALKGGDIDAEIRALGRNVEADIFAISDFFEEEYFREKWVVKVLSYE